MSSRSVPTSIIGPKGLLRDSLASLLGAYSYRVTDSHESAADIAHTADEEGPRMVLLTARTVPIALAEAALARRACPNCKVVALLEDIPGEGFWKLAHSDIDGCVPLHVSQDILSRTLDLVMSDAARIIVLADDHPLYTSPDDPEKIRREAAGDARPQPDPTQSETPATRAADQNEPTLAPNSKAPEAITSVPDACSLSRVRSRPILAISKPDGERRFNGQLGGSTQHITTSISPPDGQPSDDRDQIASVGGTLIAGAVPALSERERQIIDGLVKGQPNKIIARACGITEATVKVHMKAILRKVPCSNRTQVAIWALENASVLPRPGKGGSPNTPERARRMTAFRAARS